MTAKSIIIKSNHNGTNKHTLLSFYTYQITKEGTRDMNVAAVRKAKYVLTKR